MSDQVANCGSGPMTKEEILNSLLVKRTSDGQYGLRAQVTNVAQGAIQDGLSCGEDVMDLETILNKIITPSTIDGRICIQLFNVNS